MHLIFLNLVIDIVLIWLGYPTPRILLTLADLAHYCSTGKRIPKPTRRLIRWLLWSF